MSTPTNIAELNMTSEDVAILGRNVMRWTAKGYTWAHPYRSASERDYAAVRGLVGARPCPHIVPGAEAIDTGGGFKALYAWMPDGNHLTVVNCEDETQLPAADATRVDVCLFNENLQQLGFLVATTPERARQIAAAQQWSVTPEELARQFCEQISCALDSAELSIVNKRNAEEPNDAICHSHDFIDANECMLAAMAICGIEFEADDSEQAALMNAAWYLAKDARFESADVEG